MCTVLGWPQAGIAELWESCASWDDAVHTLRERGSVLGFGHNISSVKSTRAPCFSNPGGLAPLRDHMQPVNCTPCRARPVRWELYCIIRSSEELLNGSLKIPMASYMRAGAATLANMCAGPCNAGKSHLPHPDAAPAIIRAPKIPNPCWFGATLSRASQRVVDRGGLP
jgi:hypothetical protein